MQNKHPRHFKYVISFLKSGIGQKYLYMQKISELLQLERNQRDVTLRSKYKHFPAGRRNNNFKHILGNHLKNKVHSGTERN